MMRHGLICALIALCGGAPAAAQEPSGADPMAPLAFYIGCWRGVFETAPPMTDERCFAPMLGGRYVRDTHVVRGGPQPYAGETIYSYDAEARALVYAYYASDGGMSRGMVAPIPEALVFPADRYVGADGAVITMRAVWRPDGANSYVACTEMEQDGVWREVMRISFIRAPDRAQTQ